MSENKEKRGEFKGEKRSFDKKTSAGDRKSFSKKPFGDKKGFGDKRSFGDKKSFGDRKPFSGDRKFAPRDGEKKEFNGERSFERRPFGDKKSFGDKRPFGDKKTFGDRKPFSNDRKFTPRDDDRKFTPREDRKFTPRDGEKKEFNGERSFERRPFEDKKSFEKRPFGDKKTFGDRKTFSNDRKFTPRDEDRKFTPRDGEKREFDEKRPFDKRPFGDRKPFSGDREFAPRDSRKGFSRKPLDDARSLALRAVNRILGYGGFSSLVVGELLNSANMSDENRRFFTSLVYSTVENMLLIDFALKKHLEEFDKLSVKMKNIMRLGACQVLLMGGVTDYAAVNETVELCKKEGLEQYSGLVNWGLHRIVENKDELGLPKKEEDIFAYLSMKHSIPMDFLKVLVDDYGIEKIEEYLETPRKINKTTIRYNKNVVSPSELEKLLEKKAWDFEKTELEGVYRVSNIKNLNYDEDFKQGKFSVQGEESILAAMAVDAKIGQNIIDCCAAPGGKTAYMAEQMDQTGRIQAWDKHEHRVELINAMAKRLRLYNVRPMVRDAEVERDMLFESMDSVLVDAPCTGTGVIMSKPDIKYHFDEENLQEILKTQAKILDTCSKYVKHGGHLVYSTCSILKKENEEQIKRFLNEHEDFKLVELPESLPQHIREKQGEFGLSLLPFDGHQDGFFIARLKRL